MAQPVLIAAPAKLNLVLRVGGRDADGYHPLASLMVALNGLSDDVVLERAGERRLDCPGAPEGPDNLAWRALDALEAHTGRALPAHVTITKRIPQQAGLGGGSSDAGAVLRMLAATCSVGTDARLVRVAVSIGADVPYFLDPCPARVRGIGERIEALPALTPIDLVLVVPPIEVPTARVFRALAPSDWSGEIPAADLEAILSGRISRGLTVNDLAKPAAAMYPRIAELKAIVEARGAVAAAMSGSGGSVFGIFANRTDAHNAAKLIADDAPDARVVACQTISR